MGRGVQRGWWQGQPGTPVKGVPANRQLIQDRDSENQGNPTSKEQILRDTDQEVRSLTVAFNETELLYAVSDENYFTRSKGFYYQLKKEDRKVAREPNGSSNTQALNRYSYVQNNPLRYIDPTGHVQVTCNFWGCTYRFTKQEVYQIVASIAAGSLLVAAIDWRLLLLITPYIYLFVLASQQGKEVDVFIPWLPYLPPIVTIINPPPPPVVSLPPPPVVSLPSPSTPEPVS